MGQHKSPVGTGAAFGMLVVETIAKIRRAFFHQKKPIKTICRELKLSRKAVRRAIRSEATEFRDERSVQPMPKLGAWREQLDGLLAANEEKAARERLTLVRIFETLRDLGFDGGYDAVRRYAKSWRKARGAAAAQAYIPLTFAPGEAYQFDWSHETVLMNGMTMVVKVAHMRLCHSRMLFARPYPRETVFEAHSSAFAFFKGACTRGIYDNMKTAVETVFLDKERKFNRRFLQMCSHYLVEPTACTLASGWEKGQVENQVGLVRERFFVPRPRVKSIDELNAWLLDQCWLMPKRTSIPSSRIGLCGRRSKRSARTWSPFPAGSTASTRSWPPSQRPAWSPPTGTNTRFLPALLDDRPRPKPAPIVTSSGRTASSLASTPVVSET